MLIDELKKRLFKAMKSGATTEKEIIRTALGEATATGAEPTDEHLTQVLRKLVKANRETLKSASAAEQEKLHEEIAVLEEFLPRPLSVEELVALLQPQAEAIRAAAAQGPAMGIAMKRVKSEGASADSGTVAQAVQQLRQS